MEDPILLQPASLGLAFGACSKRGDVPSATPQHCQRGQDKQQLTFEADLPREGPSLFSHCLWDYWPCQDMFFLWDHLGFGLENFLISRLASH